jgi:hypothetical protein
VMDMVTSSEGRKISQRRPRLKDFFPKFPGAAPPGRSGTALMVAPRTPLPAAPSGNGDLLGE